MVTMKSHKSKREVDHVSCELRAEVFIKFVHGCVSIVVLLALMSDVCGSLLCPRRHEAAPMAKFGSHLLYHR